MRPAVIDSWLAMLSAHDPSRLDALIADDAVFESPIVHTPQAGKVRTLLYLTAADRVLNNEHFRYTGEWYAEDSAVLEFTTQLDGVTIDGIDMIWWNADGRIVLFKVMVRPLKAINVLHQRMAETLQAMVSGRAAG